MRLCINFHGLGEPPPALTPGEARVWLPTPSFCRILDRVADNPRVELTFDDCFASDVDIALPELTRRGLGATFFVIVEALDTPGRLKREDLRMLMDAGMRIGSHGLRHRPWRGLPHDELQLELHESRRALCGITGAPVCEAACPFGAYDRTVLREARRAGYRAVFTSDGGLSSGRGFVRPRTSASRSDDDASVARWLRPPAHARARGLVTRQVKAWR